LETSYALTFTSDLMAVPRALVSSSSTTPTTHVTLSLNSMDTNGRAAHSRFVKTDLPMLHQAADVEASALGVDLEVDLLAEVEALAADSVAVVEALAEDAVVVSLVAMVAAEADPTLAVLQAAWTLLHSSHRLPTHSPIMLLTAASEVQLSTSATYHGPPAMRILSTSSPPLVQ
jgi:hypothetical protein